MLSDFSDPLTHVRKCMNIQRLMCDTTMCVLTSVETSVRSLTGYRPPYGSLTGELVTTFLLLSSSLKNSRYCLRSSSTQETFETISNCSDYMQMLPIHVLRAFSQAQVTKAPPSGSLSVWLKPLLTLYLRVVMQLRNLNNII